MLNLNSLVTIDFFTVQFQTILDAMTQLDPPISLENPKNEAHLTYMKTVASQTDFDYPDVS